MFQFPLGQADLLIKETNMRDFFINSLELLINVLVGLMILGVAIGTVVMMFSRDGGFVPAIGVLIGGAIYVILTGGLLFLFLGIYQNTKRAADALDIMKTK